MKTISLFVAALFISIICLGQFESEEHAVLSPTAYSFARYGEVPVSTFTGVPNISIPLYTIEVDDYELPISLSYHATGIKVSQEASNVGLGWALNFGGVITKSVKGLDDFSENGYIKNLLPPHPGDGTFNTSYEYFSNYEEIMDGNYDPEPDVLVYNFNGRSGKMFFRQDNSGTTYLEPVQIEPSNLDIRFTSKTRFGHFEIVDEYGVKYVFNAVEESRSFSTTTGAPLTSLPDVSKTSSTFYPSAWYLSEIELPSGREISFTYTSNEIISPTSHSEYIAIGESDYVLTNNLPSRVDQHTYSQTYTDELTIKEISFPNGKIEFGLSPRDDIRHDTYSDGSQRIDTIRISNEENSLNEYLLRYSYIETSATGDEEYRTRLQLDSIIQVSGTQQLNPYVFSYNSSKLPIKTSKAIDHWGYYNGASTNDTRPRWGYTSGTVGTLIPTFSNLDFYLAGANREPNSAYIQYGILESIEYPTGGTTSFEYEPNQYFYPLYEKVSDNITGAALNSLTCVPSECYVEIDFYIDQAQQIQTDIECSVFAMDTGDDYIPMGHQMCWIDEISGDGGSMVSREITFVEDGASDHQSWDESKWVTLDVGWYRLSVYPPDSFIIDYDLMKYEIEYSELHTGPGLRIKTIANETGDESITKEYKYTFQVESETRSTGVLLSPKDYFRRHNMGECTYFNVESATSTSSNVGWIDMVNYDAGETLFQWVNNYGTAVESSKSMANPIIEGSMICVPLYYVHASSEGKYSIIDLSGSSLGYHTVVEYEGTASENNGRTQYKYNFVFDDKNFDSFVSYPRIQSGYNGLLNEVTSYNSSGNKVSWSKNLYTMVASDTVWGLDVQRSVDANGFVTKNGCLYPLQPERWLLSHQYNEMYNVTGSLILKDSVFNEYTNLQRTSISGTNSQGDLYNQVISYPLNYTSDSDITGSSHDDEAVAISSMISGNYLNLPIETFNSLNDDAVSGSFTEYKSVGGPVYPYKQFSLELEEPIEVSSGAGTTSKFEPSRLWSDNGTDYRFEKDNHYSTDEESELLYSNGRIVDITKRGEEVLSMIWAYDYQYPVIQAQNVHWSFLSSAVSASLPSGYSTLQDLLDDASDDPESNADWKTFNNNLRGYPSMVDAIITTYCYKPLIGVVSKTDPGLISTYYEYDDFGRLKLVRDNDGNILQEYEYNYAQ